MISLLENLSTREDAFTTVWIFLVKATLLGRRREDRRSSRPPICDWSVEEQTEAVDISLSLSLSIARELSLSSFSL